MNRALSLALEAEDETDTKLDELIAQVDLLVRRQREQVRNILSLPVYVCLSVCLSVGTVVDCVKTVLLGQKSVFRPFLVFAVSILCMLLPPQSE